ncbi:hypothetical protein PBCV1_a384cR [Paramecium bursaria Chlorella virus 1]|uniref:Uncharacterized protein n=1 Tax=Paramecium bursaria Chlorella virus 1 TaxID=10506 RepID=F8TU29_PBCV1|nr:hypothetical protein PBCV1_a384cR [Paramecium bursaria Chlorella virus 1]AEI70090.1 hypothetical protein [Paramecium bursaria Chlorella virus 1]
MVHLFNRHFFFLTLLHLKPEENYSGDGKYCEEYVHLGNHCILLTNKIN